jgi:hypothetical protein
MERLMEDEEIALSFIKLYLLFPWSWVLEKPPGVQLLKNYEIIMVKKSLQALMSKSSQSIYVQKPMPAELGDVHVISTTDGLCGSHAFQHNFQLSVA